jgi:hypothetical protein
MARESAVLVALAVASHGCSFLLDFSDSAIPKDAQPDAPYTAAECAYDEPNDTFDTAVTITPGVDTGPAAICAGATEDDDFYKFTVPMGTTSVNVAIQFTDSVGDLDLKVFAATDPSNPVGQSRGFTDGESVTCPGTSPPCAMLAPGDYIFEVFPAVPGAVNNYTFSVTIQ